MTHEHIDIAVKRVLCRVTLSSLKSGIIFSFRATASRVDPREGVLTGKQIAGNESLRGVVLL